MTPAHARLLGLIIAVAAALAACGGSSPGSSSSIVSSIPAHYKVTGTLFLAPSHSTKLCVTSTGMYSGSPYGCSGVDAHQVDIKSVPTHRYANGSIETGTIEVRGNWDGHALTVTGPPKRVSAMVWPRCASGNLDAPYSAVAQRIGKDWQNLRAQGILVLETMNCKAGLLVVVPVADSQTVSYLTQTYGPLEVGSWFTPIAASR
jgi:hypothetical protein